MLFLLENIMTPNFIGNKTSSNFTLWTLQTRKIIQYHDSWNVVGRIEHSFVMAIGCDYQDVFQCRYDFSHPYKTGASIKNKVLLYTTTIYCLAKCLKVVKIYSFNWNFFKVPSIVVLVLKYKISRWDLEKSSSKELLKRQWLIPVFNVGFMTFNILKSGFFFFIFFKFIVKSRAPL